MNRQVSALILPQTAEAAASEPELVLLSSVSLAAAGFFMIVFFVVWSHLGNLVEGILVAPLPAIGLCVFVWGRVRWGSMREDKSIQQFRRVMLFALAAFGVQSVFYPVFHATDAHCVTGAVAWFFIAVAFTGVHKAEPDMSSFCGYRADSFLQSLLSVPGAVVGLFEIVGLLVNMRGIQVVDRGFMSIVIIVLVFFQTIGVWRCVARLGSLIESRNLMRGAVLGALAIVVADAMLLLQRCGIVHLSAFAYAYVIPSLRMFGMTAMAFTVDKETGFVLLRLCANPGEAHFAPQRDMYDDDEHAVGLVAANGASAGGASHVSAELDEPDAAVLAAANAAAAAASAAAAAAAVAGSHKRVVDSAVLPDPMDTFMAPPRAGAGADPKRTVL